MEPATDRARVPYALPLDARVREYVRQLEDESMLAKLNKEDVIAYRGHVPYSVLVNEPLQPRQTNKGENWMKKETSALLSSYRTLEWSQLVMLNSFASLLSRC